MPPQTFSLGQRIRELRSKRGFTQNDLAAGLCTPSMISQIESDRVRPSYRILTMIAQRLDVHVDKLLEHVDLDLEVMSRYKMARAMVAAKEYSLAIPLLRGLLDERTSFPKTEIQLGLAQCYLQTDQMDEAEPLLKDVHDTSVIRGDAALIGVSLYHLGLLSFQRKNYQLAAFRWLRALEQVDKQPPADQDPLFKSNILTMLGHVHTRIGLVREALRYFQDALALRRASANWSELAREYLERGQTHQRLNELEKSVEYSERAYAIFHSVEDWVNHARLEKNIAISSAEVEQNDDIIPQLQEVIARFHSLDQPEEAGVAYAELAKFQLQFGDVEEAEKACQMAQRFLPEDHLFQGELHRVRGHIAYRQGEWEQAIGWFEQAAGSFLQAGEVRQWDDALYEVALVYAGEKDHRRAYDVMVDLRAYQQQALLERGIVL